MTTADFKYAIQQNQLGNNTHKVLININTYGSRYTIDDIAIRLVGNLEQLQQAITISLGISGSTEFIQIPVNESLTPVRVVDSQLLDVTDTNGVYQGSYYMYSILTPNQRVVVDNPANIYYTDVGIEPAIGVNSKTLQDYSILNGNAIISRESEFTVKSDRSNSTSNTNPINIYSIINNIATPAQVQDSNYTTTGWTNARYNGSKITTTTNFNTDPFLQGTFFEGAFYKKDATDSYINTATDTIYSQYFFSGKLETLEYTLEDLGLYILATGSQSLTLTASISSNTPSLNVGDIFRIFQKDRYSPFEEFSSEIYQMIAPTGSQQYYPYANIVDTGNDRIWNMRIKRNYSDTQTTPWVSVNRDNNLHRIAPTRVYTIRGNYIEPATEGKVKIQGGTTIVYTNKDGYVLSGSSTAFL